MFLHQRLSYQGTGRNSIGELSGVGSQMSNTSQFGGSYATYPLPFLFFNDEMPDVPKSLIVDDGVQVGSEDTALQYKYSCLI